MLDLRRWIGGCLRWWNGLDSSSDSIAAVNPIVSREPSREFAVEVAEQVELMMMSLGDDELVQLANWKMGHFSLITTKILQTLASW